MDHFILTNAFSLNMFGVKEAPDDECIRHFLRFDTVFEDDVAAMLKRGELQSYISHPGTATILSERLGLPVAFNREDVQFPFPGIDGLVVAQITKRLPPGVELSAEEIRELSIVYWTVTVLPR